MNAFFPLFLLKNESLDLEAFCPAEADSILLGAAVMVEETVDLVAFGMMTGASASFFVESPVETILSVALITLVETNFYPVAWNGQQPSWFP